MRGEPIVSHMLPEQRICTYMHAYVLHEEGMCCSFLIYIICTTHVTHMHAYEYICVVQGAYITQWVSSRLCGAHQPVVSNPVENS